MGHEAERAQPIVGYNHHHAVAGEGSSVIGGHGIGAGDIAAAVDPHQYRRAARIVWSEDIDGQAVLAGGADIAAQVGPTVRPLWLGTA